MLNTDDFIKRLQYLTDYFGLSAAVFADKIGVQRSSISHLMSGRNKPSLEFVLKILDVFPEVNLYWLLNGKGDFLKATKSYDIIDNNVNSAPAPTINNEKTEEPVLNLFDNIQENDNLKNVENLKDGQQKSKSIYKVIIFYEDGTFSDFSSTAPK